MINTFGVQFNLIVKCLMCMQPNQESVPNENVDETNIDVWQQLAEVMTPSIVKVVEFAKRVPGFLQVCINR